MSLSDWYALTRDEKTLRDAVDVGREALLSSDADAVDHAALTAALAVDTYDLCRLKDNVGLLDEAIALDRQALALTPPEHANRARWLNNLSIYLRHAYRVNGQPADLDEAIDVSREAVSLAQRTSPDRPPRLSSLSAALEDLFHRDGDNAHFDEAITLAREAAEQADEWAVARRARRRLARLLIERDRGADFVEAGAQLVAAVADAASGLETQRGEEAGWLQVGSTGRISRLPRHWLAIHGEGTGRRFRRPAAAASQSCSQLQAAIQRLA